MGDQGTRRSPRSSLLAVVAVLGAFLTRGHRGIANAAAGLRLEIDDS